MQTEQLNTHTHTQTIGNMSGCLGWAVAGSSGLGACMPVACSCCAVAWEAG